VSPVVLPRAFACAALAFAATPSEARFLQVDPVGYKDQNNLYAYVNDDPLNEADPSGMDAIVLVQDNTHIQVILPVTFSGNAASAGNVAAFTANVQQRWTGTFDGISVKTTVVQGTSALAPNVRNAVTLTSGNTLRSDPLNGGQGHSRTDSQPPSSEITMKDVHGIPIAQPRGDETIGTKGVDTFAHESGHLMGAPDRHVEDGTLMGDGTGNRVTGADVRSVMQPNPPSGMRNTIIQCSASTQQC
jgi:hypothetical protein